MSNRAILYLRSSKDRSDVSIDAQRRALHELALVRSLVVVDEFADAVESGKDDDRPSFQRLLHNLKQPARGWEHVLALDTSRVARRRLIAQLFERDCEKHGVRIVYRNVPDTDPATEMLLKSVLQAMDEWHSINSRTKGLAGMAENVRQGWRAGGRAPRGYLLKYHATGAIRDGAPVTKSRLVVDDTTASHVQAYLQLRAQGVSRGIAIERLQLRWPASSTHSMDWQALTYAGHTVWNMHGDRQTGRGAVIDQTKRRPRAEWLITRGTHPALISDDEAEAILRQQELALQGRRLRSSPLLFAGLVVTPEGEAWHSDGCGHYRLGKGPKISAARLEPALLGQLAQDLASEATVQLLRAEMQRLAGGQQVDGRRVASMEKKAAGLTTQIARTVDLAAQLEDPAPVLRRVRDLEHQRADILAELASLQLHRDQAHEAAAIDEPQIRTLLRRMLANIEAAAGQDDLRDQARAALAEVIEKIELPKSQTPVRLHYAIRTGVNLASPRGFEPLLQP
jgi:site-specific DNA recombinase